MHSALERPRAIIRDVTNQIIMQAVPDLDRRVDESSASIGLETVLRWHGTERAMLWYRGFRYAVAIYLKCCLLWDTLYNASVNRFMQFEVWFLRRPGLQATEATW